MIANQQSPLSPTGNSSRSTRHGCSWRNTCNREIHCYISFLWRGRALYWRPFWRRRRSPAASATTPSPPTSASPISFMITAAAISQLLSCNYRSPAARKRPPRSSVMLSDANWIRFRANSRSSDETPSIHSLEAEPPSGIVTRRDQYGHYGALSCGYKERHISKSAAGEHARGHDSQAFVNIGANAAAGVR